MKVVEDETEEVGWIFQNLVGYLDKLNRGEVFMTPNALGMLISIIMMMMIISIHLLKSIRLLKLRKPIPVKN